MVALQKSDLDLHFERLGRHISAALEYAGNSHTLEDVRALVEQGSLQLWPGKDSVILTEILQTPRRRTLHFFVAGGDLEEIRRSYLPILEWGKSVGCTHASLVGRKGWERTFLTREDGWTAPLIYMEKVL